MGGTVSNAAATNNVFVNSVLNLYASTTVNSLILNSGGGLASMAGGTAVADGGLFNAAGTLNTLTVTSGGVLAYSGNAGISGGAITQGSGDLFFHTLGNLSVGAYLTGSGALVKADGGTLTLNAPSFISGATYVNGGELDLSSGANTLLVIPTASVATLTNLNLNAGAVDLTGNNQAIASLTQTNGNAYPGGAGTITNTGATATLYTTGAATFVGTVAGNITLDKSGNTVLTLTNPDSRAANMVTNIRGGTLALKDSGTINNGGAINVDYSILQLDNTGLISLPSRTGSSPINLNGGTVNLASKQGNDVFTLGAVTPLVGANTFTVTPFSGVVTGTGGTAVTLASLGAPTNNATMNFTVPAGTLGAPLSGVNGYAPGGAGANSQIIVTTAPTPVNGILGGWAVVNGNDFATYLSPASALSINSGAAGIGALGVAIDQITAQETNGSNIIGVPSTAGFTIGEVVNGIGGLTNPTITAINAANNTITVSGNANATNSIALSSNPFGAYSANALGSALLLDNVSVGASVGAVTSRTINSLRINGAFTATMNTQGDTLTVASGGVLVTSTGAGVIAGGRLSAGATPNAAASLYQYASATTTINSVIANNGTGPPDFREIRRQRHHPQCAAHGLDHFHHQRFQ
ncbi:MAG: hypothetical protein WDN28_29220 [Chthoniobacter sp.]